MRVTRYGGSFAGYLIGRIKCGVTDACICRDFPLTNFWGDADLIKAAGDSLAYLDLYQVHYYDIHMAKPAGNPRDVFQHPAAYLVSSGKPIILGEIPVSASLCMLCTMKMPCECLCSLSIHGMCTHINSAAVLFSSGKIVAFCQCHSEHRLPHHS